MEIKPTEISSSKMFGGYNKRYKHYSPTLGCSMNFHIYFPPSPSTSHKFPVLYWLSGLTCTDENFIAKAVAQRVASSEGVALVVPDTSPSKNLEKKMDPNRELDARMDRLMDLVTNFVSAVGDRVPLVDVRHANPNPEPRVDRVTIEKFYKRKPTQFDGGSDPMTAVHWISDMERIFRAIECTEEQKITYSTDTLKEGAQNWWVNLLEQGRPITWDKFVEEFYKRYFPRAAKAQKRREFANLQQGDMTVNEYISKYSELLRFTKDTVITEEDKARKFEEGLRDNIQCRVETHEFGTVAQVHNAALIAERDINKYKQSQQGKRQSEGKGKGQGFFKKPFSRGPGSGSGSQGGSSFSEEGRLLCPTCNRRHRGVCYLLSTCNICKQVGHISKNCPQARSRPPSSTNSIPDMRGKCFDCGQSGHFSKDCPKKRQEASSMASSRARSGPSTDKGKGVEQRQGKSFQLTPGNVSATDSVVSGGLNVEGEADSWDFGVGAGFYLNSTQEKWKNWQMYDYIVKELPKLLSENFPQLDTSRASIFGHSMGGHGALIIYLKNLDKYKSVSAFSPITNPINCAWGQKAFSNYLGDNKAQWEEYDATCLISKFNDVSATILIDQGEEDKFLSDQLLPRNFEEACRKSNVPLLIRFQPGYDHSYFFIATFIDDHIRHHAQALNL